MTQAMIDTMLAAVDWEIVIGGIAAVGAASMLVVIAIKGVKFLVGAVRGS